MVDSTGQDFEHAANRSAEVAEFTDEQNSIISRIQHRLHVSPAIVPLIVLLLSIAVFGILLGSKFFSPFALTLILQQVAIVGIVGAAQSIVILTAGIDLSVGAIMVLSSVVMGQFTFRYGLPPEISVIAGLCCGLICGLINGILVSVMRLPPFIVTLGMWQIILSTNFLYSGNETIRSQLIEAEAPLLQLFGEKFTIGGAVFTYGVVFMIVLAIVLAYALRHTAWGRHVYAVGDDPDAAELSGVQVKKILLSVYGLSGLICAFAGWVLIGRIGSISPTSGQLANIESITAVVIGGISLFGGRGSILGMLFGALIVGVFTLGINLMEPILKGRNLVKRYGKVTALDHCDFDLYPGEILAIIGDNGAGKSSLIKAISGALVPDEGQVFLDGEEVNFRSPIQAREQGIETVYQTLAMSPALSIADNMFMGRELRKPGIMGSVFRQLDKSRMEKIARNKLSELGLMTIQNINQAVETLSGGQRQGVAVARAAAFGSKVIILDEPTAALGVKESRRVLELIQDVRKRGIPIILISHNMPHVFEVADRIHVHRLGKRLCVINPKDYSMSDAVAFMTGAKDAPEEAKAA
ncbi:Fructose import ATP-binding protein FrcA [Nymphon striatum]|nr:Fructose import ATP-binding protein FrcA [Nymphon striatum]